MEENQSQYIGQQKFLYNQQQQSQQQTSQTASEEYFCRKCGARVPRFNRFCEECGEPVDSNVCPHCNGKLSGSVEICPYCGKPVDASRCTFCGGVIEPEDNFCCDCGNAVHGVPCPVCGTVNFRNFCRNCNAPLTELAQIQLERVQRDPRVIKTQRLAVELEELEQQIMALQAKTVGVERDGVFQKPQSTLSEEDRKILETYSNLFGKGVTTPKTSDASKSGQKDENKTSSQCVNTEVSKNDKVSANGGGNHSNPQLERLMEQYQQKVKEMGTALLDLLPDPQDPPIVQRDFLCACKVMTTMHTQTKEKAKVAWACNLCGCRHNQPSECARPELGGHWIYSDRIVKTIEQKETTIYL